MDIQDNLRILPQTILNLPTGSFIGSAATTVDVCGSFNINQTTAGQTLIIPNPTNTVPGLAVTVGNVGTVAFTVLGTTVNTGTFLCVTWNGTAWTIATPPIANVADTVQLAGFSGVTTILSWNSVVLIPALFGNITLNYPDPAGNLGKKITEVSVGSSSGFTITRVPFGATTLILQNTGAEIATTNGALTVEVTSANSARQISNIGNVPIAPSFLSAFRSVSQTIVLNGIADHADFTNIQATAGTDITLDTTTTYTTAANIASRGRISLRAGKTYRLTGTIGDVGYLSASPNNYVAYTWWNVTTNTQIGTNATISSDYSSGLYDGNGGTCDVIFSPTVNTLVELRVVVQSNCNNIAGILTNGGANCVIEVIAGNTPITGQTIDYGYFIPAAHTPTASTTIPLTLSAGTLALSGNDIQLRPNSTYRIVASLGFQAGATINFAQYAICDSANLQLPSSNIATGASISSTNGDAYGNLEAVITTGNVAQVIRLRYLSGVSLIAFASAQSYVAVYQLGSSATIPGADPITTRFITSGTYTPTVGMRYVEVIAVGGGGGAAGGSNASSVGQTWTSSGSNAGATVRVRLSSVQIGASRAVTIGSGGISNTAGGNTSLGTLFTANGGSVGGQTGTAAGNPGAVAPGNPSPANGFTITTGIDLGSSPGEQGQIGIHVQGQPTQFTSGFSGKGGGTQFGNGGLGVISQYSPTATGAASVAGQSPTTANSGAGGGGSFFGGSITAPPGASGSAGVMYITEYFR